MLTRISSFLALTLLIAGTLYASDDPFCGKRKLNLEKSKLTGTATKPDGTASSFDVTDKRVGSGSRWTGTWESTDVKVNSPVELEISTFAPRGLTFYTPEYKDTLSMNFDGKDYAETGPDVPPDSTTSGKRLDLHTLEVTDKLKNRVLDHARFEVSSDGRTLTLTVHGTGQPNAQAYVYDKM